MHVCHVVAKRNGGTYPNGEILRGGINLSIWCKQFRDMLQREAGHDDVAIQLDDWGRDNGRKGEK